MHPPNYIYNMITLNVIRKRHSNSQTMNKMNLNRAISHRVVPQDKARKCSWNSILFLRLLVIIPARILLDLLFPGLSLR